MGRNKWVLTDLKEHCRSYSRAWRWRLIYLHTRRLFPPPNTCMAHFVISFRTLFTCQLLREVTLPPGNQISLSPLLPLAPTFPFALPCFVFLHSTSPTAHSPHLLLCCLKGSFLVLPCWVALAPLLGCPFSEWTEHMKNLRFLCSLSSTFLWGPPLPRCPYLPLNFSLRVPKGT